MFRMQTDTLETAARGLHDVVGTGFPNGTGADAFTLPGGVGLVVLLTVVVWWYVDARRGGGKDKEDGR